MPLRSDPAHAKNGFAALVAPGDPTFAMRKRIADMAWRARQMQIVAGIAVLIMLCAIAPTFSGGEHTAALPPAYSGDPYLPESLKGDLFRYAALNEATMHAKQLETANRQAWFDTHIIDQSPLETDIIRFQLAQMAWADGEPRQVAAQLGAMQGHWKSSNETDANVMRALVEFVRANDLNMPLRQAESIAYHATPRTKTFLRDTARPNVTLIRWLAALVGLAGLALLAASTRISRTARELLDRAKALR